MKGRMLIGALAVLCLVGACGGGGGGASAPEACTVEINADSILSGEGLAERPALTLARMRPEWKIDDRAVGGLFLAALWAGYAEPYASAPPAVFPRGPQKPFNQVSRSSHVVVIEVGGNDALALPELADFERDLRAIVNTIQAEGRVPVLTGVVQIAPGGFFGPAEHGHSLALNAVTRLVADHMGLVHAGFDVEPFDAADTFDGIHRRPLAAARLLDRLAQAVEKAAPQCTAGGSRQ